MFGDIYKMDDSRQGSVYIICDDEESFGPVGNFEMRRYIKRGFRYFESVDDPKHRGLIATGELLWNLTSSS